MAEKTLNESQEQLYKNAIKEITEENSDLRHVISGLNQQIIELKLEVEERDEALDELTRHINKLEDGIEHNNQPNSL